MIETTSLKLGYGSANVTMAGSGVLSLPTGVTSIDKISQLNVIASAVNLVFTLPPAILNVGQVMIINNVGANSFALYNKDVNIGTSARYNWTGSLWLKEDGNITAPTVPILTFAGMTSMTQATVKTVVDRTSVEFQIRVTCNIPIHTNTWATLTIPNITGYQTPIVHVDGTYRSSGNPIGQPPAPYMGCEACNYTANIVYVGGYSETVATTRLVMLSIKYIRT